MSLYINKSLKRAANDDLRFVCDHNPLEIKSDRSGNLKRRSMFLFGLEESGIAGDFVAIW